MSKYISSVERLPTFGGLKNEQLIEKYPNHISLKDDWLYKIGQEKRKQCQQELFTESCVELGKVCSTIAKLFEELDLYSTNEHPDGFPPVSDESITERFEKIDKACSAKEEPDFVEPIPGGNPINFNIQEKESHDKIYPDIPTGFSDGRPPSPSSKRNIKSFFKKIFHK